MDGCGKEDKPDLGVMKNIIILKAIYPIFLGLTTITYYTKFGGGNFPVLTWTKKNWPKFEFIPATNGYECGVYAISGPVINSNLVHLPNCTKC